MVLVLVLVLVIVEVVVMVAKRAADCGLCGEAGRIRPKEETKRIRVRKSRKSADLG